MRKYKNQTLISVFGLAVGFTCFALATLWIVYEMTFDNFHKNAKKMYVVYQPNTFSSTGYSRITVYPLAAYLKETFPEIADAIPLTPSYSGTKITVEGVELPALIIQADSSFFGMFDVKIVEGGRDFLTPGSKHIAITWEKARQLFGNEHPIGKTITFNSEELTISAIVKEMSKRSNYAFDMIRPFGSYILDERNWSISSGENTVITLAPGVDMEAFEKKLYDHDAGEGKRVPKNLIIKPLAKVRYSDQDVVREVKFQHIVIFAFSGVLVILCSLFNYLTLFVSRYRIRKKELALRVVCGASGQSLLAMLSVEFLLTLLFAVVLGSCLTQLFHRPFLRLSAISMGLPAIYRELLLYIAGAILVSLLAFWVILLIFRRRTLNLSIRQSNKNLFRKTSVIVQLVISIGFAFCTILIMRQMYFLHHTSELGFSFKDRGLITLQGGGQDGVLVNQLKQIPEITKVVDATGMMSIVPSRMRMGTRANSWDDKPVDALDISIEMVRVSSESIAFYELQLIAGELLNDADPDSLVLLDESAVKAFGWHDPVGKHFTGNYLPDLTVKGVIKNVYHLAPTAKATPVFYTKSDLGRSSGTAVLFKYREGMWKQCKGKIDQLIKTEYADLRNTQLFNSEEVYNNYLNSENSLIKLLSVVSAICILICVFGFVSLVSLTCEERRKTIAIRKINGATNGDILAIFAKEYSLLLLIGAVIAFAASSFLIQHWLEQYVKQTTIPAWVYLSILFVMALVIVLCVGWQVYKASIENPAETIKKE